VQVTASFQAQAIRDWQILNLLDHYPLSEALSHHIRNPSLPRKRDHTEWEGVQMSLDPDRSALQGR